MTDPDGTVSKRIQGVPVREIRLEVVEGPDKGAEFASHEAAITIGSAETNMLVLHDKTVSRFHAEVRRQGGRIRVVDLDSTNGTELGPARLIDSSAFIGPGTMLTLGGSRVRVHDGQTFVQERAPNVEFGQLRGRSEAMQRVMGRARQLAASDASVLVVGESGTGKELLSSALHSEGKRRNGNFVTVDCAAIAGELFASALFGHEKGSFTGAVKRHVGAFERAHRGTLFLDEVGELSPKEQAALLGVLERRRFMRVGGSNEIEVDVRIIAATNRDLRSDVNRGTFRLDLYYRLAVATLEIPPLRDRTDDLEVLIERLAEEEGFNGEPTTLFSSAALQRIATHRFPGNVRELRNMVSLAIATGEGPELGELAPSVDVTKSSSLPTDLLELKYKDARRLLTSQFEKQYLVRLLERSNGSFRMGARIASINRSYLLELLDRHGLRNPR